MSSSYDAIIIGAGPAGLTAGLYLARAGKKTICLEQGAVGGQIVTTDSLENYPGFPEGVSGRDLIASFETQAIKFGMELMPGRVDGLKIDGRMKEVSVGGFPFTAPVVIVATGIVQKLDVPGEDQYLGRGVSYCATCDGSLYRGRTAILIGSTDWAVEEALHLAPMVAKLKMILRQSTLKPTTSQREELLAKPSLELVGSAKVVEILGDGRGTTGVRVEKDGATLDIEGEGIFIASGKKSPGTEFLKGIVELTPTGFVVTGPDCATSVPGIFAAGDVRREKNHQVATAVGDGALAAMEAARYLNEEKA